MNYKVASAVFLMGLFYGVILNVSLLVICIVYNLYIRKCKKSSMSPPDRYKISGTKTSFKNIKERYTNKSKAVQCCCNIISCWSNNKDKDGMEGKEYGVEKKSNKGNNCSKFCPLFCTEYTEYRTVQFY